MYSSSRNNLFTSLSFQNIILWPSCLPLLFVASLHRYRTMSTATTWFYCLLRVPCFYNTLLPLVGNTTATIRSHASTPVERFPTSTKPRLPLPALSPSYPLLLLPSKQNRYCPAPKCQLEEMEFWYTKCPREIIGQLNHHLIPCGFLSPNGFLGISRTSFLTQKIHAIFVLQLAHV